MPNFALARRNMVDCQIRTNRVTDKRLIDAMLAVPRHAFLPAAQRALAYADQPLPLDYSRYLPSPMVAAKMIQAADIGPNDLVMMVGAGSGYGAAVVGKLASAVVALEEQPELAATARRTLGDIDIETATGDNIIVVEGPLAEGWAKQAPYDVILLESAVATIPQPLLAQLGDGGRLVAVVRRDDRPGEATMVRRTGGTLASERLFNAMLPHFSGMQPTREFAL